MARVRYNPEKYQVYPRDIEVAPGYKFDRDPNDYRERYPICVFGLVRPVFGELFGGVTHNNAINIHNNMTDYLMEKGIRGINGTWNTEFVQRESRDIDSIKYSIKTNNLKHVVIAKIGDSPEEEKEVENIKNKLSNDVDVIVARFNIREKKNFDTVYTCPVYMGLEVEDTPSK